MGALHYPKEHLPEPAYRHILKASPVQLGIELVRLICRRAKASFLLMQIDQNYDAVKQFLQQNG